MCGVIGLSYADPKKDVAGELVEGSILLQHRGQDACGFVVQGAVDRFGVAKGRGWTSFKVNRAPSTIYVVAKASGMVSKTAGNDYDRVQA